ncbi:amidase [Acidovorax sp. Be4]|uniref:Amidase n=1 Tax=Acidovorax bellezanensis TaxID=2976702 RepID=A0ABT2PHJ2_9BURK|nr:amidase [Acidovorax sp. Be4]MCT9809934.1 amidase [Acidovorax sp. Be4]
MHMTSTERTDKALRAIADSGAEGARIFTQVYTASALAAAAAADARAAAGITLGPLDGRIVSIKDLFDVAGEATTAGSKVLRDAPPAEKDAVIVQRLRAAGAILIGKTNMTEFAFSGIGINPHYGTPGNAQDVTRIPGGSSAGAGVAVARGMCEIAIGSDTGGSIRIPSAFNGVTGFKPTQARVSREGAFPLSFSLDTVGPLAKDVLDCAQTDAVLSGQTWQPLAQRAVAGLRIGVPRGLLFTQVDEQVLAAFEQAVAALQSAQARVSDAALDDLLSAPFRLQEKGTLIAAEAAHVHGALLAAGKENELDALVLSRLRRGETIAAPHYVAVQQARAQLQPQLDAAIADFDILALPTVPVVAPSIASLDDEDTFHRTNMLVLRNPSVFNFYDLPAVSLPLPRQAGAMPVGLMLVGKRNGDRELLAVATALEQLLQAQG